MRTLVKVMRGVGTIEYAIVASLISVAAVAAYGNLGSGVGTKYESIESML